MHVMCKYVEYVNFVHIDTIWYEFSYFHPNTGIAMVYEFQKNQIPAPNGYVKNWIVVQHCFLLSLYDT